MKHTNKLLLSLLFLLTLSGCKTPPSSSESSSAWQSSEIASTSETNNTSELSNSTEPDSSELGSDTSTTTETSTSNTSTSEGEEEEEEEPFEYPFVVGETLLSQSWPEEDINNFINVFRTGETLPSITLERNITHGVENIGDFYYWLEIETSQFSDLELIASAFATDNYEVETYDDYFFAFTENYEIMLQAFFIAASSETSSYIEVLIYVVPTIEVPTPSEIDNVFVYDFATTAQLVERTPLLGTWSAGESSLTVDRNDKNSNHGVGGDAGTYLSAPLRVYEGQIVTITIPTSFQIELIVFEIALTSNIYGLSEGYFSHEAVYYPVNNVVTLKLEEQTSSISFEAYSKVFFDSIQIYYI